MKKEGAEEEGKEGVLLKGPRSPSTEDEVDRSAVPCPLSSSTLLSHHGAAQSCLVESSLPVESCISRKQPIRVLGSRLSLRGPRPSVNRRYRGVKTRSRSFKLSRSVSRSDSFATGRLSFQSETTGWPLAPWTVSLSNTYSSESHKCLQLSDGSDNREHRVLQRTYNRHGRILVDTAYFRPRKSMEASMAEVSTRRMVEGVVAREASEHPQLVRYIGHPSKLSPSRNPTSRTNFMKDINKEGIVLEAVNKRSPQVSRAPSVASRLRASLRWRKPRSGEEKPGLRRGAIRRSTTTVSDHVKTTLLILPKAASSQTHVQAGPVNVVQEEAQRHHQDHHR